MRQKYHFATDNGILIWDVTSILEDIEQHPDSYTIQTLSTALLADHNDARVSHTRAMASDLTKPLVVAELSKDHLLLIDGNHRLHKARKYSVLLSFSETAAAFYCAFQTI